ncbi:MAG: hypothetical protein CSB55_01015, partial [Candidatus Cloacimonadota bacterium]
DELTYTYSGNTNIQVSIDAVTSVVTFTPDANWFGSETIVFTATDQNNAQASDDVVVTVNSVNDTPVINLPANFSFAEDTSLIEDFGAYISDNDADNLSLIISGNTEIQVSIEDLSVTFTASENWNGTETLTFTVNDNSGRAIASSDADVTVTPVNDAPVVVSPLVDFSMDEDTTDNSIILNNVFTDADLPYGDELTYSYSGNTHIQFSIDAVTSVVTVTPDENWFGSETIVFTATDQNNAQASDDVIITVNSVNDTPVINLPANFSFAEDTSLIEYLGVYMSDNDADDLSLSVSGNTEIQVAINGLSVILSALNNWNGTETLTFTVNDNRGKAIASSDTDVTVTPVNDAPVVAVPLVDFSMDEDTTDNSIVLNNVFTDFDFPYGDELTYSYSGNTHIQVSIDAVTSVVTVTPDENWFGSETIVFTATDQNNASASDDVVVTVNNINDDPVLNLPANFTFEEDTSLFEYFGAYVSDIDPDDLTLSVSGNTEVHVAIDDLSVTFTASENWNGTETLTFSVNDGRGKTIVSSDTDVTVTGIADTPVVVSPLVDFSMDEDTTDNSIVLNQVFTDADLAYGDELTYSYSGNTHIQISIDAVTSVVTLTPDANWFGSEAIMFTATDQNNASISDNVIVTVNNVNDDPIVNLPESFTVNEDETLTEDFGAYISDIDPDDLTLTAEGNNDIIVEINNLSVTFSAPSDWNGSEIITFTVNDNARRASVSAETEVIFAAINDAPKVAEPLVDIVMNEDTEDKSINLKQTFIDIDEGDELEFSVSSNIHIVVNIDQQTGDVTLIPNENWFGVETIVFTATDQNNASVSDDVMITINNVNDAPDVNINSTELNREMNLDDIDFIDLNEIFSDNEGNDLIFGFKEPRRRGFNEDEISASIDGSVLKLQTVNGWYGVTRVIVSANDGEDENNMAFATFTITISNVYTNPEVSLNITAIDFGTVFVDHTSDIKTLAIENISIEPVITEKIVSPPDFMIRFKGDEEWNSSLSGFTIDPQSVKEIEVIFTPSKQVDYSANITVNSNAVNNPSVDVSLKGSTRNPVPNAFTPNGDGKNDLFTVSAGNNLIGNLKMYIYNSGGKKIKEISALNSSTVSWDGKDEDNRKCKSSPYLYYIEKDGSRIMRGKVYLLK